MRAIHHYGSKFSCTSTLIPLHKLPIKSCINYKILLQTPHALIHHHGGRGPVDLDPISSPQRSISERPEHPSLHTAFSFPDVKHL